MSTPNFRSPNNRVIVCRSFKAQVLVSRSERTNTDLIASTTVFNCETRMNLTLQDAEDIDASLVQDFPQDQALHF